MYYFVYQDTLGNLQSATSMQFVARHPRCRAVHKSRIEDSNYETLADFLYDLNYLRTTDAIELLTSLELVQIY